MSPAPGVLLLVLLLLGVLMRPGTLNGLQEQKIKQGRSLTLPCEVDSSAANLTWEPSYPTCAGVWTRSVDITLGGPVGEGSRFRNRLSLQSGSLVLSDVVMSDSGVFTCTTADRVHLRTELQVEGGCFKNVSIAFKEEKFQKPTLFCKVCNRPQSMPASAFSWTVNGVPVKDGQRTKPGARIAVDPFSKEVQGRWTCTSAENPEWQAEYCLELAASDYTPPVDLEADDDAGRDTSLKLFYLAFVVAGTVLTLTLGAILFACCLDRKSSEREKEQAPEEELENMAGAQLPSAALPTPESHPSGQRSHPPEIRDTPKKTSDGLLYAQLDHFPIKQDAKRPSPCDRATIYATIV